MPAARTPSDPGHSAGMKQRDKKGFSPIKMIYEKLLSEIRALEWTQKKLSYKGITIRGFYGIKKPLNTIFGKIWWLFWGMAYCYPAIYRPIKLYIDLGWSQGERDLFMDPRNTFAVAWYTFDDEFFEWRSPWDFGTATIYEAIFFIPFWFIVLAIPYHFLNCKLGSYLRCYSMTKRQR
jgi:hypothetical protein